LPYEIHVSGIPVDTECDAQYWLDTHLRDLGSAERGGLKRVRLQAPNAQCSTRGAFVAMVRPTENIWLYDRLSNLMFRYQPLGSKNYVEKRLIIRVEGYCSLPICVLDSLVTPLGQISPETLQALGLESLARVSRVTSRGVGSSSVRTRDASTSPWEL
jgi:hypothetical protein